MADEPIADEELDKFQDYYKRSVESWINAIRSELALASVQHSAAALDQWEAAHLEEEKARDAALEAKKAYEDALRLKIFKF